MDRTATLEAVRSWPIEEQFEFLCDLWDQLVETGWQPELTEELRAELDRRMAAHEADPQSVLTWEQIVARVRRAK